MGSWAEISNRQNREWGQVFRLNPFFGTAKRVHEDVYGSTSGQQFELCVQNYHVSNHGSFGQKALDF